MGVGGGHVHSVESGVPRLSRWSWVLQNPRASCINPALMYFMNMTRACHKIQKISLCRQWEGIISHTFTKVLSRADIRNKDEVSLTLTRHVLQHPHRNKYTVDLKREASKDSISDRGSYYFNMNSDLQPTREKVADGYWDVVYNRKREPLIP